MEENLNVCPKCFERQGEIGPETLMSELGDKCFEKTSASDWSKRKEALDKLQQTIQTNHLQKDGNYQPLLKHLRKVILTDLCVIVVGLAVQCVTSLAKVLGKYFGKYADGMCQILFEKFVEKRQRMNEVLREAVDTIFETTRFESLQNTIIRLLRHNNPTIRYEIILFLTRSFPKCNKIVLSKPQFQPLFLSLKSLLADGDMLIREKTLAALGAAVQVAGETAILPYIRDLDLASKAKIEVYQLRAWETAKTYNEMKFPYFMERSRKPRLMECPLNEPRVSLVNIPPLNEEGSKLDVYKIDSVSKKSVSTASLNDWESGSEKEFLEAFIIHQTKNMSTISGDSKTELINNKKIKKELSLSAGGQQNRSANTSPACVSKPEYCRILSHSNIDVETGQTSLVEKKQKKHSDRLGELKNEMMIRQFTEQCRADVAHHLKQMTKERRFITYRQPTEATNEIQDHKSENTTTFGNVLVEPEIEIDESQIGFTKKELEDLVNILNAARSRARAKENLRLKRKSHSKKRHRYTTMSKGVLNKPDHKETQCTIAVAMMDRPTQTLLAKEKPNSISCIVNCCNKCTRLLLATASPNSKYLFPLNTDQQNTHQRVNESSDNTMYREMVSSDQMQAKSESELINTLQNELVSSERKLNHNPNISRSYEITNVTLHNVDVQDKSHQCQNDIRKKEAIVKPSISSNVQSTDTERKSSSKSRDKRMYWRNSKASTCNKTTYVTTTGQRRRRKRKKNRSRIHYPSQDELSQGKRSEWLQKEFYKTEGGMKVRVIRIE